MVHGINICLMAKYMLLILCRLRNKVNLESAEDDVYVGGSARMAPYHNTIWHNFKLLGLPQKLISNCRRQITAVHSFGPRGMKHRNRVSKLSRVIWSNSGGVRILDLSVCMVLLGLLNSNSTYRYLREKWLRIPSSPAVIGQEKRANFDPRSRLRCREHRSLPTHT